MRRFQLCEHTWTQADGVVQVHGRLKVWREDGWSVIGVFQLTEDEWDELTEICRFHGVQVTNEEPIRA